MKQRRWDDAAREFREGLCADPENISLQFALGVVHSRQGCADRAIRQYLSLLEIKPDLARARYNLALAYQQLGDLERAMQEAERAIALGLAEAPDLKTELRMLANAAQPQPEVQTHPHRVNGSGHTQRASTQAPVVAPPKLISEDVVRMYREGRRDFGRARMSRLNLRGAQLSHINLSGADLRWATLDGADLTEANLRAADLTRATLIGARLTGADLRGARFLGANLSKAVLRSANLSGAVLNVANLRGADLSECRLSAAKVGDHQLPQARTLRGAILPNGRRHR